MYLVEKVSSFVVKHQPEIENKEDLEIIQDKIGYVKDSEHCNIQDYIFFVLFFRL